MSEEEGNALPERIDPDAIIEALVEFRFEHSELPELVLGRLLDAQCWEGYTQTRLPTADIPQPLREVDPNLLYQPFVELQKVGADRVAKIGGHVLSYHVVRQYPGWTACRVEIEKTLGDVITKLKSSKFSRIGLRYINAFWPNKHFVRGLADTNIVIKVDGQFQAQGRGDRVSFWPNHPCPRAAFLGLFSRRYRANKRDTSARAAISGMISGLALCPFLPAATSSPLSSICCRMVSARSAAW